MRAKGGRALRVLRGGALPACAALLLAGCASMPSSGEVRKVDNGQQADADAQVRVFGIPPHPDESAEEIVSGFLEATTSGEPDFATAKKYLATKFKDRWNPLSSITVLSAGPQALDSTDSGPSAKSSIVGVSGSKAAVVDAKHAYLPDHGAFHTTFNLVRQGDEWRISALPNGLILSASDFQRIYHSVNMYYFAELGSDADRSGTRHQTLVADPVYLRQQQTDSLAATVSTLLGGPTDWLAPAVASAAPTGLKIYGKGPGQGVTLDDSQRLKVRLNGAADRLKTDQCVRLAAQLFATVQGQASAKLASAEVQRANGATICSLSASQAADFGPANLVGPVAGQAGQYFIGSEHHQLYELMDGTSNANPVHGPFGSAKADLASVAVRRDEQMAAGVKTDGRRLVVGSLTDGDPLSTSELTSSAQDPKNGLSAPSWDGLGDLWIADRSSAISKLYVLRDGTGAPNLVDVPKLDGRVESLRVASDGVRIVLVVDEHGVKRLQLGRIDRGGTLEKPQFSVTDLRDLTPAGETVGSVSWAGASRLVVLGSDVGGGQQIQYVNTDGSAAPALESIGEAVAVAASEVQSRPLLASYNGSVYWLPDDSNWKRVTPKGIGPVYPG
ncbi:LpqB family beta-propeller domain-containing protein [Streptomyces sp. NPDC049040]|uniref:LpqB family beta-propeller domain-containing protein n=1 Tax=Streptomyces sp. NPDC049040 TaxID=3365593 RepID=UPI0037144C80